MARDPFGFQGQIVDGQLRVDEAVGEGGFSVVYRGLHLGLNEPVAIKCLKLSTRLDSSLSDAFNKRFRDEGRLAYRLSQGNLHIVRSITSGSTVSPTTGAVVPYMALEWLDGRSLAEEITVRTPSRARFSLQEAVALFDPAVKALDYAHSQSVIHRDIKPGNLFLTRTREGTRLKVLDFGLAKILHDEKAVVGVSQSVKTINNMLMCSPSYGAPEQFDASVGPIGPWTDVYAFALVFIEALTLQKARPAGNLTEGAIRALDEKAIPLTPRRLGLDLGDAVEAVLTRALQMRPQNRQQSAQEMWSQLRDAMLTSSAVALTHTLHEDVLPQAVRARAPEEFASPQPFPAPPAAGPLPEDVAPGDAPPVTLRMPSAPPKALTQTVRMDESPALPWEMMRAVEQAADRRAKSAAFSATQAAPTPSAPSVTAAVLPSTFPPPAPSAPPTAPGAPGASVSPASSAASAPRAGAPPARVRPFVVVLLLVLLVIAAATFAVAFRYRARLRADGTMPSPPYVSVRLG